MAISVARVHLKVAHGTLPALLPTPPEWTTLLPLLPSPCVAAILPKRKPLAKPSRTDSNERWDAHKKSSSTRSTSADDSVKSSAGRGSCHKSAMSPPPKPGRADSVERWDAHKKPASPSSSSSSSSGSTSSLLSSASSAERWDVNKKRRPPQAEPLDDGESNSTGSNDVDTGEEEILWKPRALYAGQGFAVAAPEARMHASHADIVLGSRCIARCTARTPSIG